MLLTKVISRRAVVLLTVSGLFLGALLLASLRLGNICEDGSCETLSNLRHKLPTIQFQHDDDDAQGNAQDNFVNDTDRIVPYRPPDPACRSFPNTSNVLLIMKTGASEANSKIPTQLMSNLKCLSEFLIFSDLEQEIVGYHVRDSLDEVLPEAQTDNSDFELYHRQKECVVDIDGCNRNHNAASQAWSLDKYKNVHMAEKTWRLRPNYDWYLYVDADTYVLWPTMVEWLKRLDPSKKYYLGSVAYILNFPFAHGGSGYLVSHATMEALYGNKTGVANKWDQRIRHECCGDAVFGKAIKNETGVDVKNIWPTINGEKPHTLAYGSRQWCHPIATMHHVGSQDVSDFDAFEREHDFQNVVRIKDIYHRFFEPHLVPLRNDWDNFSEDDYYLDVDGDHADWEISRAKKEKLSPLEATAHVSFQACQQACLSLSNCFQWRFRRGVCTMAHSFAHGNPTKVEKHPGDKMISGWNVNKIRQWVADNDECGDYIWPKIEDD